MAFKIKDLMISIAAPVSAACARGEKANEGPQQPEGAGPIGCPGKHTDIVGCVGHHTDVEGCPGHRTDVEGCPGHHTDIAGCTGKHTDMATCPGHHTDIVICVGRHTDIGICVGRQTQLAACTGHQTDVGDRGEKEYVPQCGRCTLKSPKQDFSGTCDPAEMLDELNIIKAQLQAELAEVDGEIRQIEDTLQPKTIGEVEELQTKLQEALEELGKIKAEIEKK